MASNELASQRRFKSDYPGFNAKTMKAGWLILFLVCSIVVHLGLVVFVHLDIDAKKTPVIYSWPGIINRDDLLRPKSEAAISERLIFSSDRIRRNYFSQPHETVSLSPAELPEISHRSQEIERVDRALSGIHSRHFYLWEQAPLLTGKEPERVSYRLFVSKQGKVIFMYPDKLTANSSGELRVQEHIRSASFFLNDNFFWTKIEGVVK